MEFGPESTAEDVLAEVNLAGKRVLVTGASAGVGRQTVKTLAEHGAEVLATVRTPTTLIERSAWGSVEFLHLDLSSMKSVRACADALMPDGRPIDVVIANAGVMAVPFERTVDGFELQFSTNYLGHFLLIHQIASLIPIRGRVVMVASAGHRKADINLDDPNFNSTPYDPLLAYRQSKTATVLFASELDRRNKRGGFRATSVHPGAVLTETTERLIAAQPAARAAFNWKSVGQGAATAIWAAFVAPENQVGGQYCEDCAVAAVNDDPSSAAGVRSYALDANRAKSLWDLSEFLLRDFIST